MTPPKKYDVHQAALIVGKSPSWMYQQGAAGNIPRTKIGHHVSWTDEQLTQIIRDGAQEPKQAKPREKQQTAERRKPQPARPVQQHKPMPANAANIPTADFSVSRLYRQQGAA
jgi:hypothetical protein